MDTPTLSVLRHAMQAYAMRTQALADAVAARRPERFPLLSKP